MESQSNRRGRIAPSPTGMLHLGHAVTFSRAFTQMKECGGTTVFRMEDLDHQRCNETFVQSAIEDLRWWGIRWDEGPDVGGPFAPYNQSERFPYYLTIWEKLWENGCIYPSPHSRKDVAQALSAPNEGDESDSPFPVSLRRPTPTFEKGMLPGKMNWRFRVPDGKTITFNDSIRGEQSFTAGTDFGDFLVWRKDGFPSYELAVVADDHAMQITDVLRGEDLLLSTARQILIYQALRWKTPDWHHAPLLRDTTGRRLAKRHNDLALHTLRSKKHPPGIIPEPFTQSAD